MRKSCGKCRNLCGLNVVETSACRNIAEKGCCLKSILPVTNYVLCISMFVPGIFPQMFPCCPRHFTLMSPRFPQLQLLSAFSTTFSAKCLGVVRNFFRKCFRNFHNLFPACSTTFSANVSTFPATFSAHVSAFSTQFSARVFVFPLLWKKTLRRSISEGSATLRDRARLLVDKLSLMVQMDVEKRVVYTPKSPILHLYLAWLGASKEARHLVAKGPPPWAPQKLDSLLRRWYRTARMVAVMRTRRPVVLSPQTPHFSQVLRSAAVTCTRNLLQIQGSSAYLTVR